MAVNLSDRPTQTDQYEVVIDGVSYPVEGPISVDPLSRFQPKNTFGDYSEDSDPLQSAAIWRSFTGGIGQEELKEGVDDETYRTGTLETRYPGSLTLLPATHVHDGPVAGVAMAYPLADFPAHAPSFWASFDATLCRWDAINAAFTQMGTLPAAPVNRAVEYFHLLYIPLGPAGYATVAEDGTISVDDTIHARAFTVWDNKLAVLTDEGELRLRFEDTAWEGATPETTVPSGSVPRNLVVFRNSRSEPTIHIVTSNSVGSYDRDASALYLTELQFPHHPDQGRASVNWRGESLYVSVGLGIHSYNGSIVAAMGPDGRYGLPAELRGTITGMEAEYNGLLALIKGFSETPEDLESTYRVGDTSYLDDFRPWVEMQAKSSLLRFSGYGWHPVWESPDVGGDPTWPHVSVADGQYWLWWGWDGQLYRQKLPHTFHNPKQGLRSGVSEFAEKGDLITGWFDADMPAFRKLASHMEIVLEDALGTNVPTGTATLYYQVDDEPGWKVLGTTQRVGRTVLAFGLRQSEGSSLFSDGLAFTRIRFRLELKRTTSDDADEERFLRRLSPVVRVFMLKFIKLPMSRAGRAFTFRVPLTMDRGYKAGGTHELAEKLIALTAEPRFVEMLHGSESYRIRVSQVRMTDMTGYDGRAVAEVSAVEVVVPQDEVA